MYPVCSYFEVFQNLVGGFWQQGSADRMLESLAAWGQVLCLANMRQQSDEHAHPDVLDSESITRSVDNAAVIGRQRGCAILVQQPYS